MLYLQGTIGYTIFINSVTRKKIIVFADMHDKLPPCPFPNSIKISKWFNKKFKTAKLLLEEVVRVENMKLEALWDASEHTNDLKLLFLNNQNEIEAIDIRPYLIPYSWETVKQSKDKNMLLRDYFKNIIIFLNLENDFLKNQIKFFNQKISDHLKTIQIKFMRFLIKNKHLLGKSIIYVFNNNQNILEDYNTLLNDCMEWYTCLLIEKYKNKTVMIHAGLYHTEKINSLLKNYYKYEIIYKEGINFLVESRRSNYICQPINGDII